LKKNRIKNNDDLCDKLITIIFVFLNHICLLIALLINQSRKCFFIDTCYVSIQDFLNIGSRDFDLVDIRVLMHLDSMNVFDSSMILLISR